MARKRMWRSRSEEGNASASGPGERPRFRSKILTEANNGRYMITALAYQTSDSQAIKSRLLKVIQINAWISIPRCAIPTPYSYTKQTSLPDPGIKQAIPTLFFYANTLLRISGASAQE